MNIAIIGAGLSGSLAAISLAKAGTRVDLYERLSDEDLLNRNRTYALTHSSQKILDKLNLWTEIASKLIPKSAIAKHRLAAVPGLSGTPITLN